MSESNRDLTISLDPGVTTGVAFRMELPGRDTELILRQIKDQYRAASLEHIYNLLVSSRKDFGYNYRVVIERFTYQRRQKVELFPVEVIGVVRLYCEEHDVSLYEQSPAQAKKLWTDDKLKKLGLWEEGQPHAMDALRHLLYYETVTRKNMEYVNGLA